MYFYTYIIYMYNTFYIMLALDEGLGIVDAKAILSVFAEKIPTFDRSVAKDVAKVALTRMQTRIVSFEEQVR